MEEGVSALIGGVVGVIAIHVALDVWERGRGFLQNRRLQRVRQREAQVLAHHLHQLFYDEEGLPTRMDPALIEAKLDKILAQFTPYGAMVVLSEFIERERLREQVEEKPQPLADIVTEKGEARPHA